MQILHDDKVNFYRSLLTQERTMVQKNIWDRHSTFAHTVWPTVSEFGVMAHLGKRDVFESTRPSNTRGGSSPRHIFQTLCTPMQ